MDLRVARSLAVLSDEIFMRAMFSEVIRNCASDRRCWLFALTALLAIVLAFFSVPDHLAITVVSRAGFWFVMTAFAIWLWSLWRSFAHDLRAIRASTVDWVSVAVVLVGGCILLAHESFGFKIVMDELMLLGTSMSMHMDKTVLTPIRGNDIQGAFVIVDGIVDKRPLFFPFLVSLVHDLTGYRPENPFVLNSVLTFVFLGLVAAAGRMVAGRAAGWIGVVLFAGLPLLGHNSTGAGFELLNVVMILATLLLGARYVAKRDGYTLTALCFSGLLMAQVRYESCIFLLPLVLTIIWVWARDGKATLPWPVILAPLLMVHYPLHHRIFDIRASSWEMASKPGYSKPFALDYVPENLVHALKFFFGPASDQPNSIVLSALGAIAIPFFLLLVIKRIQKLSTESPINVALTLFALGFAAQFALMMCYFWGKFDDPVIRRLSLPTHLGMVLAVVAVLPQFAKPAVIRSLLVIAVVGLLARSVPSMAAHAYSQEYLPGRETAWRREFIKARPLSDYLMIDNDATLWIAHRVSATPTVVAVKRREDIAFHLRNRTFSDVYVFQRLTVDPDTGVQTLREGDDLGPEFVLEPVIEQRLQLLTISRISRITAITQNDETVSRSPVALVEVNKSRAEIEEARQLFLQSYMKQLP
jgi:hypothetical protein